MYVFKNVFINHANYSAPLSFATEIIIIRKKVSFGGENNKGADQPAHLRSLISAFVICLMKSIIYRLAPSQISLFLLFSVAEQAGFGMT